MQVFYMLAIQHVTPYKLITLLPMYHSCTCYKYQQKAESDDNQGATIDIIIIIHTVAGFTAHVRVHVLYTCMCLPHRSHPQFLCFTICFFQF